MTRKRSTTSPKHQGHFVAAWLRGLNASVIGNAHAFGFSITVTVTYGVVSAADGSPSRGALLGFAIAAVTAFSLLNLCIVALASNDEGSVTHERALLLGTMTDFLAVGAAVAVAIGVTLVVDGLVAWLLAPFLSGLTYVLVQSIELAVGREEVGD